MTSSVRHPNVVTLLDVFTGPDGDPIIVLELVRGMDLHALVRSLHARGERMAPSGVALVGGLVARGLGAANRAFARGVVHRDVTPHNVLISRDGEVKLADFGIARALDRGSWTAAGLVKGKPGYVSPEALRGAELDARSDLFSLGVVLYELLAGARLFTGRPREVMRAIPVSGRRALGEVAPETPPALVGAIHALLAEDPTDRPSSPDIAARWLLRCCERDEAEATLRASVRRAARPQVASLAPRPPWVDLPTAG